MTERAEKADAETEKNGTLTEKGEKKETIMAKPSGASDTSINGSPGPSQSGTLIASFKAFSKFGDTKSDGRYITLSQSDKWMKQANVIDGKTITTTDTGIYFKKHKSTKLSLDQYRMFLEDLAKGKKVDLEEMKKKMANCGPPGLTTGLTGPGKAASTVDRLTDVSKYTGSHKQRFDQSGRGRGIAGRKDLADDSGYVQGYQNKDTYDKGH